MLTFPLSGQEIGWLFDELNRGRKHEELLKYLPREMDPKFVAPDIRKRVIGPLTCENVLIAAELINKENKLNKH